MASYLCNAFSLNMLPDGEVFSVTVTKMSVEDVKTALCGGGKGFVSAIGHEPTARVLSDLLGRQIEVARINVMLGARDQLIVAQYHGPRLPEGATTLPEGAGFTFYRVAASELGA